MSTATMIRRALCPIEPSRLEHLKNQKNKQAVYPSINGKRKVTDFENVDAKRPKSSGKADFNIFDAENIAPSDRLTSKLLSNGKRKAELADSGKVDAKRPKSSTSTTLSEDIKPSALPKSTVTPASTASSRMRTLCPPKSPAKAMRQTPNGKLRTGIKKRASITSTRRRTGPTRVEATDLSSTAPFSLDAAVKGTISDNASKSVPKGWCFEIHEDTPEQEMTNLLQHSTCTLDISSEEEHQAKIDQEIADGCNKENIPPADHVSQTPPRPKRSDLAKEDRVVLGEIGVTKPVDETSIIIVPRDDEDSEDPLFPFTFEAPGLKNTNIIPEDIDALMSKSTQCFSKAADPEPIEDTGDTFELWESSSAKDGAEAETETVTASSS